MADAMNPGKAVGWVGGSPRQIRPERICARSARRVTGRDCPARDPTFGSGLLGYALRLRCAALRANPTYLIIVSFLAAAGPALGENLPDPTRPPPSFSSPEAETPVADRVPVLQSVLLGKGRRTAILDGRVYREGEAIGAYKLGKITRQEVRLNGPAGEIILRLPSPAGNLEKKRTRR